MQAAISKQEQLFEVIRGRIVGGEYAPGARIVADAIAREFATSVGPVREAIRRLEALGLVRYVRNVGAQVTLFQGNDLANTLQILALLEGPATALAAPYVRASDIRRLQGINAHMREAAEAWDLERLIALDRTFHQEACRRSPNAQLLAIIENCWERVQLDRRVFMALGQRPEGTIKEHERLIALFETKAPPRVIERLVRRHDEGRLRAYLVRIKRQANEGTSPRRSAKAAPDRVGRSPASPAASYGQRLGILARTHPERTAIIFVSTTGSEQRVTWQELESRANQTARLLEHHGVGPSWLVAIGLPNGPEHFVATFAAWKLGACVLPLRHDLPPGEYERVLRTAQSSWPVLAVADWRSEIAPTLASTALMAATSLPNSPLPDRVPHPGKAIGSGGSTGAPKIIVAPQPWSRAPGEFGTELGLRPGQVQLVAGALYHNSPFGWSHEGLFEDHCLVVMEKFNPTMALDLIERHGVNFAFLAPTMLLRMARVDGVAERNFASLHAVLVTGSSFPAWLKRAWIKILGPTRLYEAYGAAEAIGKTIIRGDDWLQHVGSVGKPYDCDLRILDDQGQEVPPRAVGEIFMRPHSDEPTYRYVGSPPAPSMAGYVSVGDMGWCDEDGYLYIADRRVDLVVTGGANVYPAEVEAAITEHPAVADVAVIGVPDEEWGRRVHAVIEPSNPLLPPTPSDLDRHCRERLAGYKVPKSYEFVHSLPREPSGKIRRSSLAADRAEGWTASMLKVTKPSHP